MCELSGPFAPGIRYICEQRGLILDTSGRRPILREFTHDGRRLDVHLDMSGPIMNASANFVLPTHAQSARLLSLLDLYNAQNKDAGRSLQYFPAKHGLYPNRLALLQKFDNPDPEVMLSIMKEYFSHLFAAGRDISEGSARGARTYLRRVLNAQE